MMKTICRGSKKKKLIRQSVRKQVPVLGLCPGAQLIASAHGATVYQFINETGCYPVHTTTDSIGVFTRFHTFHVFQMHGETFYIPVGGRLRCRGSRVPHQGFRLGSAFGLQFHLEMTEGLIRNWIRGERKFLKEKIDRDTNVILTGVTCCAGRLRWNFCSEIFAIPMIYSRKHNF